MSTELPEGRLEPEYTAWCGLCADWERVSGLRRDEAKKRFRALGWRKTKVNGWVCQRHTNKEKRNEK